MLEKYRQAFIKMEKEENFLGILGTMFLGAFWIVFLLVILISFISWTKIGLGTVRAGIVLVLFTFAHFYILTSIYGKK